MAIARLLNERVGAAGDVVGETGEVERAGRVGVVVEPPTAPIRDLETSFDDVAAGGPADHISHGQVMFCPSTIGLRPTAAEGIEHDDLRRRGGTVPMLVLIADQDPNLMQKRRGDDRLLIVDGVLLDGGPVDACRRQRHAADALVALALVVVRRRQDHRVVPPLLMRHRAGCERVAVGIGHVGPDGPQRVLRHHRRLGIFRIVLHREREPGVVGLPQRTTEKAFGNAPLLGWLRHGKGIAGVQRRIAKHDSRRARVMLRPRLRHNFDAPAPWLTKLRCVRVLIDFDLLDGGGGQCERIDLDAVDDEHHAVGADGRRIEKSGHRADHVFIEDGKILERVLVHGG